MPFLNCVEKSDQDGLTETLPVLYKNMSDGKLDRKRVQGWMDTHSNGQTIPTNRTWEIFATWNVEESCRRCENAVWLERFLEDEQNSRAAKL